MLFWVDWSKSPLHGASIRIVPLIQSCPIEFYFSESSDICGSSLIPAKRSCSLHNILKNNKLSLLYSIIDVLSCVMYNNRRPQLSYDWNTGQSWLRGSVWKMEALGKGLLLLRSLLNGNACRLRRLGANLAHIQPENLQNVQKVYFWLKAQGVNGSIKVFAGSWYNWRKGDIFSNIAWHLHLIIPHSRPQSLRSFWPVAGIESSGSNHFEITKEITEFWPSGLTQSSSMAHARNGCSQSSRFLPQARGIVGSGDENDHTPDQVCSLHMYLSKVLFGKVNLTSTLLQFKLLNLVCWKKTFAYESRENVVFYIVEFLPQLSCDGRSIKMCSSRKYPYSPPRRDWYFLGLGLL